MIGYKMAITKKFKKPEALITLLLSQVRTGAHYCQRAWQKITAANRCCEQYKANSKLIALILTTHNRTPAHNRDEFTTNIRNVKR
ncbi:MAG: hypothetical protein ABSG99_04855 [Sedimentisphaerales bacterium]